MTTEDLRSNEVLSWREDRLLAMGFDPVPAFDIAHTILDLHQLEDLLGRGCPPQTAIAIVQ
jgi:hypothetical protein